MNFNNFAVILIMKVIRIKELRRREERLRKVKELIGGSAMDPVDKTKCLFEMFQVPV
jgi:hypothetical protein